LANITLPHHDATSRTIGCATNCLQRCMTSPVQRQRSWLALPYHRVCNQLPLAFELTVQIVSERNPKKHADGSHVCMLASTQPACDPIATSRAKFCSKTTALQVACDRCHGACRGRNRS
jgi:hypothetical protein